MVKYIFKYRQCWTVRDENINVVMLQSDTMLEAVDNEPYVEDTDTEEVEEEMEKEAIIETLPREQPLN